MNFWVKKRPIYRVTQPTRITVGPSLRTLSVRPVRGGRRQTSACRASSRSPPPALDPARDDAPLRRPVVVALLAGKVGALLPRALPVVAALLRVAAGAVDLRVGRVAKAVERDARAARDGHRHAGEPGRRQAAAAVGAVELGAELAQEGGIDVREISGYLEIS